jgi:type IV pilus assembly protein PilO
MSKWSELPVRSQLLIIFVVAITATAAMYFLYYKSMSDANDQTAVQLKGVNDENASLLPYDKKLDELERQIGNLGQQLEQMKQIVPDEKEADQFIRMVQATANSAGIEVRQYSTKPIVAKEFFVEAPFEIDIDGPYYSVLAFFDKMSKLERIINVSNLQMASVGNAGEAKVKHHYTYAPGETVVATCVATTYFTRGEAAAPAAAKPATATAQK